MRWRAPELVPRGDARLDEFAPTLTSECDIYSLACVALQVGSHGNRHIFSIIEPLLPRHCLVNSLTSTFQRNPLFCCRSCRALPPIVHHAML